MGLAAVDIAANVLGATVREQDLRPGLNLQVIAAAGGPGKGELARRMGAAHCIDYHTQDIK